MILPFDLTIPRRAILVDGHTVRCEGPGASPCRFCNSPSFLLTFHLVRSCLFKVTVMLCFIALLAFTSFRLAATSNLEKRAELKILRPRSGDIIIADDSKYTFNITWTNNTFEYDASISLRQGPPNALEQVAVLNGPQDVSFFISAFPSYLECLLMTRPISFDPEQRKLSMEWQGRRLALRIRHHRSLQRMQLQYRA